MLREPQGYHSLECCRIKMKQIVSVSSLSTDFSPSPLSMPRPQFKPSIFAAASLACSSLAFLHSTPYNPDPLKRK